MSLVEMSKFGFAAALIVASTTGHALASSQAPVPDDVIAAQRSALAASTDVAGFGPQAPRDIDDGSGTNPLEFESAPPHTRMNLCNIHFHKGAEHKGGAFTTYAGNGDGKGYGSGYVYNGELTAAELTPLNYKVGDTKHGGLQPGDAIAATHQDSVLHNRQPKRFVQPCREPRPVQRRQTRRETLQR